MEILDKYFITSDDHIRDIRLKHKLVKITLYTGKIEYKDYSILPIDFDSGIISSVNELHITKYYENGKLHRIGGPAIIVSSDVKSLCEEKYFYKGFESPMQYLKSD